MKKTLILSICSLLMISCSITAKENNKKSLNSISESNNQYTITFKNDEGSILSTKQYAFGVKPSEPSTPSKENPVKGYKYTFSGWSPSVSLVTNDATYVATYKVETDKSGYLIKWVDGDGKILLEENYNYGDIPNYHGDIPTKKSTSTTSYVFNGWEQDIKPVDVSRTYTAKFDSIPMPLPSQKYSIDINCANCSIKKHNVIHEEYSPNTSVSYQFENISDDCYHYPFDLDVKVDGIISNDYNYDSVTGKLDIVLKGNTIIDAVGDNSSIDALIKFDLKNDTHKFIFTFDGSLDYVDWGDGNKDNLTSHTYYDEEKHIIRIYGNFTNFSFKENTSLLYSNIYTSKIKQISESAFEGCASLKSYSISKSVTKINSKAFMNCTSLTSVEIPDTVTCINSRAFYGCTSLNSISIPNSVTLIDSEAFYGCTSLNSISIPNGVTLIDSEAFYGCTSLTSLVIPPSVNFIGFGIVKGCWSLKSITIPSVGSFKTSPETGKQTYYSNFTSILGDESTSSITGYPNLEEVIITSPCKSISEFSFENCFYITTVKLPSDITSIPDYAFRGCRNLSTIYISSGLKHIGCLAFEGCSSLLSFKFNEFTKLEEIDANAFMNCTNIVNLKFSSNLKKIGEYAFVRCSSLKKVYIPSGVNYLGGKPLIYNYSNPFSYCESLEELDVDPDNKIYESKGNTIIETKRHILISGCKNSIIPNGVEIIDYYSFMGIPISSVSFPNSVTNIRDSAFKDCYSLSSVVVPNSLLTMGPRSFYVDNRKIECVVDMSNVDHLVESGLVIGEGHPFEDNDGTNLKIKVRSEFVDDYTAPGGLFSNCKNCVIGV